MPNRIHISYQTIPVTYHKEWTIPYFYGEKRNKNKE